MKAKIDAKVNRTNGAIKINVIKNINYKVAQYQYLKYIKVYTYKCKQRDICICTYVYWRERVRTWRSSPLSPAPPLHRPGRPVAPADPSSVANQRRCSSAGSPAVHACSPADASANRWIAELMHEGGMVQRPGKTPAARSSLLSGDAFGDSTAPFVHKSIFVQCIIQDCIIRVTTIVKCEVLNII